MAHPFQQCLRYHFNHTRLPLIIVPPELWLAWYIFIKEKYPWRNRMRINGSAYIGRIARLKFMHISDVLLILVYKGQLIACDFHTIKLSVTRYS